MQEETPMTPSNQEETSVPAKNRNNINVILTIINIVMLLGLIILYFIVLKPERLPQKALTKASGNVTVAYVNSDTILAKYTLVKHMREELERNTVKYETELKNRQSAFEKDASYFQEQVSKKAISESSAQEVYASLMQEQQKLYDLREKYSGEISKKEFDMNQLLLDSLNNFLKRYNKRMNFDYIFSYNRGGSILTANDSLDITNEVLEQLNGEYKKKND